MTDMASRVQPINLAGDDSDEDFSTEADTPVWDPTKATPIPDDMLEACDVAFGDHQPKRAIFTSNTNINGFVHSTESKHRGNSQVMFTPPLETDSTPGYIQRIFTIEDRPGQYLAVRRLRHTDVDDPFSEDVYPLLGVKLWGNSMQEVEIISVDQVDAQFASCLLEWENQATLAVISLSRVSAPMI